MRRFAKPSVPCGRRFASWRSPEAQRRWLRSSPARGSPSAALPWACSSAARTPRPWTSSSREDRALLLQAVDLDRGVAEPREDLARVLAEERRGTDDFAGRLGKLDRHAQRLHASGARVLDLENHLAR